MIYECKFAREDQPNSIKELIEQGGEFVCVVERYAYFRKQPLIR
jgi:hypothetical protein